MFFLFRWAGCICGSGYLCSFSCACSSCSAAPLALPAPAPVAAPAPAPVPAPGPAPAPAAGLSHKRSYAWKAPGGSKQFAGPADQWRVRTAPARERKARPAGAKKKRRASCTEPWKRKTVRGLGRLVYKPRSAIITVSTEVFCMLLHVRSFDACFPAALRKLASGALKNRPPETPK